MKQCIFKIQNLKKYEWAYIAGILDGEGSISAYKRGEHGSLIPAIQVSNTNYFLLEFLSKKLGGKIYPMRNSNKPRWKPCWSWQIHGKNVLVVLKKCFDFFIVKKEQCQLVLSLKRFEYLKRTKIVGYDKLGRIRRERNISQEDRIFNDDIITKLRKCNEHGHTECQTLF